MAVQQLTQPILNPIDAFDATKPHYITFVVIGGAQVIGNNLIIQNNQTGEIVYNQTQSILKLEHVLPANTLSNGVYYNATISTISSSLESSTPSVSVPFYCYSQPILNITNIPESETIENGTYTFQGSYVQNEGEILNSYQYTLYNSNKEVLNQTPLIYYQSDSSLSHMFVAMSNDTSYFVELSGETVNGTKISSGLIYFTIRYIQPPSFAICDLANNCDEGYIQISSNIVAIDGHSNPDPPIYIDDKEVDLTDPDSWVNWNTGFRIQDDFTMRIWGRNFNDYQNIVTLTNNINTNSILNKIELKWMIGDVIKELPEYKKTTGELVNLYDSEKDEIKNLMIEGNNIQYKTEGLNQLTSFKEGETSYFYNITNRYTSNTNYYKAVPLSNNWMHVEADLTGVSSGKYYINTFIPITKTPNIKPSTLYTIVLEFRNVEIDKFSLNLVVGRTHTDNIFNVFKGQFLVNREGIESKYYKQTLSTYDSSNFVGTIPFRNLQQLVAGDKFSYDCRISLLEGDYMNKDYIYEPFGLSPTPSFPSKIYSVGDKRNLININDFEIEYEQQYHFDTNCNFSLEPNYTYSLSFDYLINSANTDIYFGIGYGDTSYTTDIVETAQYINQTKGRNSISFIVPSDIPPNSKLWVRFCKTIILADINVSISNIQLEKGNEINPYQNPNKYNIYPTVTGINLYNYDSTLYLKSYNVNYNLIQNGYNISPKEVIGTTGLGIGFNNVLNEGDTYSISYNQLGNLKSFRLYTTLKESQDIYSEIEVINNTFVAPKNYYDLQLFFTVDNSILSNSVEIWNVQIEASDIINSYESYEKNSTDLILDNSLNKLVEVSPIFTTENYVGKNIVAPTIKQNATINKMEGNTIEVPHVPDIYQEVEYIESTGTQYLNIGFKPNQNTRVLSQFQLTGSVTNNNKRIFGARNPLQDKEYYFGYNTSGDWFVQYGSGSTATKSIGNFPSIASDINIIDFNKTKTTLNSTSINYTSTAFQCDYDMYLFCYNSAGSTTLLTPCRIYYCKIWDNDTVVRSLIPCYRKSDNVIGMYDTINNVFYTNLGTGTFLKGNNYILVNPEFPIQIKTVADDINLFNKDSYNSLLGVLNITSHNITSSTNATIVYIPCKKNTKYTVQKKSGMRFIVATSVNSPTVGTAITNEIVNNTNTFITITTDSTCNYLLAYIHLNGADTGTLQEMIDSIKIEEGLVANPYSAYNEGTAEVISKNNNEEYTKSYSIKPLCKLDETFKDTIDFTTNKIVKKCNYKILNGSENWVLNNSNDTIIIFRLDSLNNAGGININSTFPINLSGFYEKLDTSTSNFIYIGIKKERLSSLDVLGFKTWLSNNNISLIYILNSEIETSIEFSDKIKQFNNETTFFERNEALLDLDVIESEVYKDYSYRDFIALKSLNLLNPITKTAFVNENSNYYYSKNPNSSLNIEIEYLNSDNNVISTYTLNSDTLLTTPKYAKKIFIKNIESNDIINNELQINEGSEKISYYPYIENPSLVQCTNKITLNGTENWEVYINDNNKIYSLSLDDLDIINNENNLPPIICDYYKTYSYDNLLNMSELYGISCIIDENKIIIKNNNINTLNNFKNSLVLNPITIIYKKLNYEVLELNNEQILSLNNLETYNSISNIFTDNTILGNLNLKYVNGYSLQQTENAYVLLKCWNTNTMPYIIHSNYIDIPDNKEKIFIWVRRKKNLFDLKIENLGEGV